MGCESELGTKSKKTKLKKTKDNIINKHMK